MRSLCRKTVELCCRHPILWLPYILAQLLVTLLWWVRGTVDKGFVESFRTPDYIHGRARAAMAYIPIGFSAEFACGLLFVCALVVTSKLVAAILVGQQSDLTAALKTSALRWREVLRFSLKAFIVCLVSLAIFATFFVLIRVDSLDPFKSPIRVGLLMDMFIAVCAAAFLIPATVRLLQTSGSGLVKAEACRQGVLLAIGTAVCMAVLTSILPTLEAGLSFQSQAAHTALGVVHALIANSPFAPLFISLSILSSETSPE
jgi:hypothetical protein